VPVAGRDAADRIGKLAGETVVLEMPPFFHSVAEAYRHRHDVTDKEVMEIMR
jgi:predicted phosphoribosyltransferase